MIDGHFSYTRMSTTLTDATLLSKPVCLSSTGSKIPSQATYLSEHKPGRA